VGPSGEEIFTDKYGRVKVQFHWDRDGKNDADSSCWVRVGTNWAGKRFGMIHIPRIGQEVIVDFLEGHPDQPIIVGGVYNAEQMPPFKLPDWKTKSGIRTQATIGGGKNNSNEVRFEDKVGSEQLFLRAEKDMETWVNNDSLERIGRDRHFIVERDVIQQVKRHRETIVKENDKEKIDGDASLTVKGKQKMEVKGGRDITVQGGQKEDITGDLSIKVSGKQQNKVGMAYALDAGTEIHLKGGMKVVIEAGLQLSLKAGASFVDIGPAGVTISGSPLVNINSGGAAGSGSGCSTSSPSSPSEPKEPELADDGTQNVD
jgi:type VI secretion system secreted protein VgrG